MTCEFPGCDKPRRRKKARWCNRHYYRYRRYGDPGIESYEMHGKSYTPEYQAWRNMKLRCTNPDHPRYADWGGRGITVCDRWMNSFEAFYEDMGPRPGPGYSVDRKDNDGNYEADNCQWATKSEQQRNKRVMAS